MSGHKLALGAVGLLAAASLVSRRGSRASSPMSFDEVDWSHLAGPDFEVMDPAGHEAVMATGDGRWPNGWHKHGATPDTRWFRGYSHPKDDPLNDPERDRWVAWSVAVLDNLVGTARMNGRFSPGTVVDALVGRIYQWEVRWARNYHGATYTPIGGMRGNISISGSPMGVVFLRHELIHAVDNALGGGHQDHMITDDSRLAYQSKQKGSPLNELIESVVPVYREKVEQDASRRERAFAARLAGMTGLDEQAILAGEVRAYKLLVGAGMSVSDAKKIESGGFGINPFSGLYVDPNRASGVLGRNVRDSELEIMGALTPGFMVGRPFSWYKMPESEQEERINRIYPSEIGKRLRGYLMGRHEIAARVIDQVATIAWEQDHGQRPPGMTPASAFDLPRHDAEPLVEPLRKVLDWRAWKGRF